ncbi:MAG: flagellar hook-basal body complex protein FliE [Cellvibrio sp.]
MNSIIQAQQSMLSQMEQIKSLQSLDVPRPAMQIGEQTQAIGLQESFSQVLKSIDAQQHKASDMMAKVDAGLSDDLVGTMVESQKASIAFSALVQVRNKVTGAFEEVMRLQM